MQAPGAWAHRVAMNLARSHFRRRMLALRSEAQLRPGANPADGTAALTASVALQDAIDTLPERQRIAVVLRYFADLPVREVATAMRCPQGTVKTLTRQAILALRAKGLVDKDITTKESSEDVS
jgi:RNA polymerase sigma-70 factor (ECF subfamily)